MKNISNKLLKIMTAISIWICLTGIAIQQLLVYKILNAFCFRIIVLHWSLFLVFGGAIAGIIFLYQLADRYEKQKAFTT